jgi:ribosomal protein S18 acetylase RimI-like enzyme
MRVRRGNVKDWPFMHTLGKDVIPVSISPWRKQSMEDTLKYREKIQKGFWTWIQQSDSEVFLAENDQEEPVGYLVLLPSSREELTGVQQGWIMDVAVTPEYRGRGVGRLLIAAAEAYCRENKILYLGLAVSTHNLKALQLYEGLGFVEERKLMVKVLDE